MVFDWSHTSVSTFARRKSSDLPSCTKYGNHIYELSGNYDTLRINLQPSLCRSYLQHQTIYLRQMMIACVATQVDGSLGVPKLHKFYSKYIAHMLESSPCQNVTKQKVVNDTDLGNSYIQWCWTSTTAAHIIRVRCRTCIIFNRSHFTATNFPSLYQNEDASHLTNNALQAYMASIEI